MLHTLPEETVEHILRFTSIGQRASPDKDTLHKCSLVSRRITLASQRVLFEHICVNDLTWPWLQGFIDHLKARPRFATYIKKMRISRHPYRGAPPSMRARLAMSSDYGPPEPVDESDYDQGRCGDLLAELLDLLPALQGLSLANLSFFHLSTTSKDAFRRLFDPQSNRGLQELYVGWIGRNDSDIQIISSSTTLKTLEVGTLWRMENQPLFNPSTKLIRASLKKYRYTQDLCDPFGHPLLSSFPTIFSELESLDFPLPCGTPRDHHHLLIATKLLSISSSTLRVLTIQVEGFREGKPSDRHLILPC
ncbi:hypothetical protein CC2G_003419 [Coprinopsis cinerea AmutBmut pab1-1]|nr:hypothetical protein CC2G_003419 [Coprinopsis cinerea AmutBmut pab1-1]